MLSSVEQAFVGREEIRAPLKTPAWEATSYIDTAIGFPANNNLLKGDLQLYLWCYPVLQLLKPANPPCLFDFFFVLFFHPVAETMLNMLCNTRLRIKLDMHKKNIILKKKRKKEVVVLTLFLRSCARHISSLEVQEIL